MDVHENGSDSSEITVMQEVNHLKMRVDRIEKSIKLSPGALFMPTVWNENCLNAVSNCINEWRTIVSFHRLAFNPTDSRFSDTISGQIKSVSLDVFMLAQLAMQTGPLSGSKPAYFKRCGGEVAKMAHSFLVNSFGGDVCKELLMTDRQRDAISKWITGAEKAVDTNETSSKGATLKQKLIATGIKTKKIFKA